MNFGCPAKVVNRHGGGAALLQEPERIAAVVAAVRRAVPVFIVREAARDVERSHVSEPITFFADGRPGYDIQYLRTEEIIVDILRHYERYRTVSVNQRTQLLNRAPGHTEPLL